MHERDKTPESGSPRLVAEGISIAYSGRPVVEALDLAIPAHSLTALIGPNGCGKSTLLKGLARMLPLTLGTVNLDGRSTASLSSKEIARRIGILLQGPTAPEGISVGELVEEGRYPHRSLFGRWSTADEDAVREALQLTGLTGLRDRPLDSLSGGQRQRAWIAMALAQQTQILLLDEPTTYLDLTHQLEILELLRSLVDTRGTTVVAVLHDVNQAARFADHVVMMKNGRIFMEGAPASTITPESLKAVFDIESLIVRSPIDGSPLVVPIRKYEVGLRL